MGEALGYVVDSYCQGAPNLPHPAFRAMAASCEKCSQFMAMVSEYPHEEFTCDDCQEDVSEGDAELVCMACNISYCGQCSLCKLLGVGGRDDVLRVVPEPNCQQPEQELDGT